MFDTFVESIELSTNNRLKALQLLIRTIEDGQHVFLAVRFILFIQSTEPARK